MRAPKITWWRMPFAADTWRRTGYAVVALAVGLVCLLAALCGAVGFAAKTQHALAPRLLGAHVTRSRGWATSVGYGLISLPVNLIACVATLYLWSLVPMNVGIPLRSGSLEHSWSGPVIRGLTWLQARLAGARAAG